MTIPTPRPRILVTVEEDVVDGQWDDYSADYAHAIEAAGGDPIPMYYGRYRPDVVPEHAGLVVIGGIDVDPAQYGEAPHKRLGETRPARDVAEAALIRLAIAERRPLLAICRGAQLFNVTCGGSLLQHIESRLPHRGPRGGDESGWHSVTVTRGSLLARIAGEAPLLVNSRHHQAVTPERLAPSLAEAGRTDEDRLIVLEAIELRGHPFALGVQWHPERPEMRTDPASQAASTRIFESFIGACIEAGVRTPDRR